MLAEEQARDGLGREERGLRALRYEVLLRVGLDQIQLVFGERGVQRHVREHAMTSSANEESEDAATVV